MENTVLEHMNTFLSELSHEMADFKILTYDKEKREMVKGNLFVDTISQCLDGRQLSVPIRYADKNVRDNASIFMWVNVLQDEKDGIRDDFGYFIELHVHKGHYDFYKEPNLANMYNEKHSEVFGETVKKLNLPLSIFKIDEVDKRTKIYVPIVKENFEKQQKEIAIRVIKTFYNSMNKLAEQEKKDYEETIFSVTNDFKARAEEFIRASQEKEQEGKIELPNVEISLELYEDTDNRKSVFISETNSSGCKYVVNNLEDVANILKDYIKNCKEN